MVLIFERSEQEPRITVHRKRRKNNVGRMFESVQEFKDI